MVEFPAVALIDSNWGLKTLNKHLSRVVRIGELVLLVDYEDGPTIPFVTWGRVAEVRDKMVYFEVAAENNRWTYAKEDNG